MKYTQSMSFADIEKAIPLLAKRGASFRSDIQSLIVSVARAWHSSGNAAHAAKLLTAITNEVEGYYSQALLEYCMYTFGLKWEKKAYVYTETKVSDDTLKLVIQGKPFYEYSPPKDPKPADYTGLLWALLNKNAKASDPEKLAKRKADGLEDKIIPLDVAREIKTILAKAGITEA